MPSLKCNMSVTVFHLLRRQSQRNERMRNNSRFFQEKLRVTALSATDGADEIKISEKSRCGKEFQIFRGAFSFVLTSCREAGLFLPQRCLVDVAEVGLTSILWA